MVQGAGAERAHGLVQPGADPRDLGLGDPRVDAHRLDQVVDTAGGDALDVGLHHHRIQRLVDAAAGLEDHRKERPLAELGDPHTDVAGLGSDQPRTRPVAVGGPRLGALVTNRADLLGGFGFDELLHHHPDRLTDKIHALTGTEHLEQLGQGRLGQGHRWFSFSACLAVTHRRSRRWPPTSRRPAGPQIPTTPRDAPGIRCVARPRAPLPDQPWPITSMSLVRADCTVVRAGRRCRPRQAKTRHLRQGGGRTLRSLGR